MIETLKIMGLTVLTLGNLIMLGVAVYYWKTSKDTTSKAGGVIMVVLSALNTITAVGGMFL
ncbi:hypothetical protein [Lactobacillus taiwanensis]|uniref:hypothetical protein n=1 Tax=Lactobacillus taiwanensis TaxID=508451 RepID=UPI0027300AE2|nr:hypothetical protein [Lactobacillus taiwanensis]